MATILLVIHLLIAIALVATILLQRSEGGALGIGGGGGGGLVSNRGAGNLLTRASAILAGLFFLTSISLTLLYKQESGNTSILDAVPVDESAPLVPNTDDDVLPVTPAPAPLGAEEPAAQGPLVPRAE
jgi:preprotein translocase subunit SecG